MKRWGGRVLAVAVAVSISAGVIDLAIRVFRLIPDTAPIPYVQITGDESFALRPNGSGRSIFGVVYHTNSRGFRGPDEPRSSAAGTIHVALVGDSVVWGYGLPGDDTISQSLARAARAQEDSLQVWNLGVAAYDSTNERAHYARFAPKLRPDVTVVLVLFNDLRFRKTRLRVTPTGLLANPRRHAPYPDSWRPSLDSSVLFQWALHIYSVLGEPWSDRYSIANLPSVLDQLEMIRKIAARNGSTLVVAAMPGLWPDQERFGELSAGLSSFCRERDLRFVDLRDALGSPPDRRYFLPGDSVHPNPEGARRIANVLLPVVDEAAHDQASGVASGSTQG